MPGRKKMAAQRKNQLKLVRSKRVLKTVRRPRYIAKVRVKPTARQVFQVFKKAPGYEDIVAKIPKGATLDGWVEVTK